MFNLAIGKQAQAAQKFVPVHPDPAIGKDHGLSLTLYGKHSPQYRDAAAALMREQKEDSTQDDRVRSSAKFVASCCASYEGAKGKFDPQALEDTLALEDYRWLRVQCDNFMARDDNYFVKPVGK